MPYNPGIQYRGDQYLYSAIAGLGKDIGEGIKQYRNDKRESDAATATFETMMKAVAPMVKSGAIPDELGKEFQDAGKFAGMSLSAKKAKLGSLVTSFGMLMRDQEAQANRQRDRDLKDYRDRTVKLQEGEQATRDKVRGDTMGALAGTMDNEGDAAVLQQYPNADPGVVASHLDRQAQTAARRRDTYGKPGETKDLGNGERFVFTSPTSGQVVQPAKVDKEKEVSLEVGTDAFGQPRVSFTGPPDKVAAKLKEMGFAMPAGFGAQPGAAGAKQFKAGDRARQDGVLYEFDGKGWKPVK